MFFKHHFYIILILAAVLLKIENASAQLITDNQSRLKIATRDRQGFLNQGGNSIAPQKSAPIPRDDRKRNIPRYSIGNPYGGVLSVTSPRFTTGNPFGGVLSVQTPRYSSSGKPFVGVLSVRQPRYSSGNPYGGVLSVSQPRYSIGNPYGGVLSARKPRYSSGNPYGGVLSVKAPRYSQGNPYGGVLFASTPRYSEEPHLNNRHKSLIPLNSFWDILRGNQYQSPTVNNDISKPKFDRKEREIWNN